MLQQLRRAIVGVAVSSLAGPGCGDDATCEKTSSDRTCLVARVDGTDGDELGFRFGEPRDLDGDLIGDLVAGARRHGDPFERGQAHAWTLAGAELARWDGDAVDGLFGNIALAVPDLDGDGTNDVIVAAPHANLDGYVDAYSVTTGQRLWRVLGQPDEAFGWHIALAGDHDGDGVEDLWVGAPGNATLSHVYLVSGRSGRIVLTIPSPRAADLFGWYLVATGDLDGDGKGDVAIGAPGATFDTQARGAVTLASSATGRPLRQIVGELPDLQFGEMLAALDDLDGDGVDDLAIGAPGGEAATAAEVSIVSGATGTTLHRLSGREDGELYGRMLATIDDLDGDGARDLAIGAPWWNERNGRVEIRSARSLRVLATIEADDHGWFGWHITRAGTAVDRAGIAVSKLHAGADAGAVEVHVFTGVAR